MKRNLWKYTNANLKSGFDSEIIKIVINQKDHNQHGYQLILPLVANICFKAINIHNHTHSFEISAVSLISIICDFVLGLKNCIYSTVFLNFNTDTFVSFRSRHVSPMPSFLWDSKMSLKHQVCTLVYGYFEIYMESSLFTWGTLRTLAFKEEGLCFQQSS